MHVTRRSALSVVPLILISGCTSTTGQAYQRFFAAVKKDGMFLWKPNWLTSDASDVESGDKPFREDTGARLTRIIGGQPVPSTALNEGSQIAIAGGWVADSPQFFRRNLQGSEGPIGARLNIYVSSDQIAFGLVFERWSLL